MGKKALRLRTTICQVLKSGTIIRQVLKDRKNVRITYIPHNASEEPQSHDLSLKKDKKVVWASFLGSESTPQDIDIDAGILVIRFDDDAQGGTAFLMPAIQAPLGDKFQFHQFTLEKKRGGPGQGGRDFNECIERHYEELRNPKGKDKDKDKNPISLDVLLAWDKCKYNLFS